MYETASAVTSGVNHEYLWNKVSLHVYACIHWNMQIVYDTWYMIYICTSICVRLIILNKPACMLFGRVSRHSNDWFESDSGAPTCHNTQPVQTTKPRCCTCTTGTWRYSTLAHAPSHVPCAHCRNASAHARTCTTSTAVVFLETLGRLSSTWDISIAILPTNIFKNGSLWTDWPTAESRSHW